MSETCRGHLRDKIIIKLFASSWYIFLTYIYDARSHLYQNQVYISKIMFEYYAKLHIRVPEPSPVSVDLVK